jgi:hypothetical protein
MKTQNLEVVNFPSNSEKFHDLKEQIKDLGGIATPEDLISRGFHPKTMGITSPSIIEGDIDKFLELLPKHTFLVKVTPNISGIGCIAEFFLTPSKINKIKSNLDLQKLFQEINQSTENCVGFVDYEQSDIVRINCICSDFEIHKIKPQINDETVFSRVNVCKLNKIIFDGEDPKRLIHDAFLHYLRQKGPVDVFKDEIDTGSDGFIETIPHERSGENLNNVVWTKRIRKSIKKLQDMARRIF